MHVTRTIPVALTCLTLSASMAGPTHADTATTDAQLCAVGPGVQGIILSIHRAPDASAAGGVYLQRQAQRAPARPYCFVRQGDRVTADQGAEAMVRLGAQQVERVDASKPLTVPTAGGPAWDPRFYGVLAAAMGPVPGEIEHMAHEQVASTRDLIGALTRSAISIPGLAHPVAQTVDAGAALLLRWHGGTGPFRIRITAGDGTVLREASATAHTGRLELTSLPPAGYDLSIVDTTNATLRLPLTVIMPDAVPAAPGLDAASDAESRALLQAVWMLRTLGPAWRLAALSRLDRLAVDNNDLVAQAIVGPPPQ